MKRVFDVVVAISILMLLWPLFLVLWLLVLLTSPGGGFYKHPRVGRHCKIFTLYKFRSMVQGADTQGYQTQAGDARITPVGKFLRKTSLDELPQLWNVLAGDMSLVGPRPDTPMQEKDYTPEQWHRRHSVRPGITGLAQVNGRSNMSMEDRLAWDLQYVETHGFLSDIVIIFQTISVVAGKGVN
ncbi:MAG: sugar transferase [Alphaproteobacteria bacterium]